jgi:hypothetical protein
MNPNTYRIFFNNVEKITADSGTPGNIFEFDESGIQILNKSDTVKTQRRSKTVCDLSSG